MMGYAMAVNKQSICDIPSSLMVKLLPRLPSHEVEKFKYASDFAIVNPASETASVAIEESNAKILADFPSFKTKERRPPIKGINISNKTIISQNAKPRM